MVEQVSRILDQVSDAVIVVSRQGQITYCNPGAQTLFELRPEQVFGSNAFEVLYEGQDALILDMQRESPTRGSWSGEISRTTRSNKVLTIEHRHTALVDESGAITGFLCIDIDVTARKTMERLSNRSQRLESVGTLAGGIAHDLNNILTPILMGAKLLASGRAAGNQQAVLDTMIASAQHGTSLVQQLLALAGGIQGVRQPVRIEQLIAETRGLLEHTLPKSIQLETAISLPLLPVLGDTKELAQVLVNLCTNARDSMPDGGKMTIGSQIFGLDSHAAQMHPDAKAGTYVLLTVSDTGCGMTADTMDRIFDPFYTTKEHGKGTGLGLAMVQGIVKSHGGFVTVYSEPERGSTFSIYLPSVSSAATSAQPEPYVPMEDGNRLSGFRSC